MRLRTRRRGRDDETEAAHSDLGAAEPPTDGLPPAVVTAGADDKPDADDDAPPRPTRRPLYHRLLRLRHIAPTAWQRAAFADAPLALAVVLVLADVASAWTLVVLPLAVAVVVKTHDLMAGALAGPAPRPPGPDRPRR